MNRQELMAYLTAGAKAAEGPNPYAQADTENSKLKTYLDAFKDPQVQDVLSKGGSAKVGEVALGADPTTARVAKEKAGEAQAIAHANSHYQQGLVAIQKSLNAASEGLDAVNDPSNKMSKGQFLGAATRALGLSRFPNKEEAAQLLPPTLQGKTSQFMNWLGAEGSNPMNDADRQAANSFLQGIVKSQEDSHNILKQDSLGAAMSSPYAADSTRQHLSALGAPTDQLLTKIRSKYQNLPQTQGPNLAENPNPGPLDKLKSFFSPSGGKPQQPIPTSNQAPKTPSDPIADELAKRAAQSLNQPKQPTSSPQSGMSQGQ